MKIRRYQQRHSVEQYIGVFDHHWPAEERHHDNVSSRTNLGEV